MNLVAGARAMEVRPVSPSDIASDPRFHCSFPKDIPALEASVARSGILNPVWLIPSNSGLALASGFRRLRAAIKARLAWIPAVILHEADEYELLLRQAEENNYTRGLNLVEKALLIHSAQVNFGRNPQDVTATMFPAMGLEASMVLFSAIVPVAGYGPQARLLIASSGMSVRQAAALEQFQDTERELVAGWMLERKLGLNKCVQALEALLDIRVNQGISAAAAIAELEMATPGDWDASRRADFIFGALIRKSRPALAAMERDFGEAVSALALPPQARISPPKNFEGRHLELTVRSEGAGSLAASLAALGKLEQNALEKLFRWI